MLLKWCTENQFELVEFSETDDGFDQLNEYNELQGMNRLIELIEIHPWSNCDLISKKTITNTSQQIESNLSEIFENEHENEGFTAFLSQLNNVKSQLTSLSLDQRNAQAVNIVRQVWDMLGGDSDEIDDPEEF